MIYCSAATLAPEEDARSADKTSDPHSARHRGRVGVGAIVVSQWEGHHRQRTSQLIINPSG